MIASATGTRGEDSASDDEPSLQNASRSVPPVENATAAAAAAAADASSAEHQNYASNYETIVVSKCVYVKAIDPNKLIQVGLLLLRILSALHNAHMIRLRGHCIMASLQKWPFWKVRLAQVSLDPPTYPSPLRHLLHVNSGWVFP